MKKTMSIFLALLFMLALVACADDEREGAEHPPETPAATTGATIAMATGTERSQPSYSVGDIMQFGGYDWRVLDVHGEKILILTDKVIMTRSFHSNYSDVTWETSALREYLNGWFYENEFTSEEKGQILKTEVINRNFTWTSASGGNNTQDRIFLLSLGEVLQYFGRDEKNDINNSQGMHQDRFNYRRVAVCVNDSSRNVDWILRTPGKDGSRVMGIWGGEPGGRISDTGGRIDREFFVVTGGDGIRPALWFNPNGNGETSDKVTVFEFCSWCNSANCGGDCCWNCGEIGCRPWKHYEWCEFCGEVFLVGGVCCVRCDCRCLTCWGMRGCNNCCGLAQRQSGNDTCAACKGTRCLNYCGLGFNVCGNCCPACYDFGPCSYCNTYCYVDCGGSGSCCFCVLYGGGCGV